MPKENVRTTGPVSFLMMGDAALVSFVGGTKAMKVSVVTANFVTLEIIMSNLVPRAQIEQIVGRQRHATAHYGRAVSNEGVVYILHSIQCLYWNDDLRDCPFSVALDQGIEVNRWVEDEPVLLCIVDGRLLPDLGDK